MFVSRRQREKKNKSSHPRTVLLRFQKESHSGAGNKRLCPGRRGEEEPKSPGVYGREHGGKGALGSGLEENWERRGPPGR